MVDLQTIINIVFGIGLPAVGWAARELYDMQKTHRRDFDAYKEKVAETYVTKATHTDSHAQLRDDIAGLRDMLRDFLKEQK